MHLMTLAGSNVWLGGGGKKLKALRILWQLLGNLKAINNC